MGQQDLSIDELASKIERGDIRLPEMQRQYVWRQTRVRDLLDSLYRSYPSGTILTWETDDSVATREFAIDQDTDGKNFQLLLDGQQRLTSLSAIIRGKLVSVRGRKRPIDILFNLEHPDTLEVVTEVNENDDSDEYSAFGDDVGEATEDELLKRFDRLAFVVASKKLTSLPNWVSVTEVFRESSDTPFLKAAGVATMDDPRYDKYTDRLKKLRSIREYQYRVHILDRDKSYEEVTEIFVRVNSLGAKLRGSDLALAQITATWRNSLRVFQQFEQKCKAQGFDLGLGFHMRNLVAFATKQSRFRAVSGLSQQELQNAWETAKHGIDFALNFLVSNASIDSPSLLSSPFIIITVANYGHFKNYELSPDEAKSLRFWLLTANAKARYSRGSSEAFLDQDLNAINRGNEVPELVQILRAQVGRLEILPADLENRNSRSAYFKTMFLAFKDQEATDWRDQLVISLKHSGTRHVLQFHHIFPRNVLDGHYTSAKINDICNLAFVSGRTNRRISDKEPLQYLPAIVNQQGDCALTNQAIPLNRDLWHLESYEDFLEKRRDLVAKLLNDFLADTPQSHNGSDSGSQVRLG